MEFWSEEKGSWGPEKSRLRKGRWGGGGWWCLDNYYTACEFTVCVWTTQTLDRNL